MSCDRKQQNESRSLADRLIFWNRLSMRRSQAMQMLILPSLIGLILARRRQKKQMKEGF